VTQSTTVYAPYMGMMTIRHGDNTDRLHCVGSQTRPHGLVEISLHSAGFNTTTREVEKGELLFQSRMSEYQFGIMVGKPNFNEGQLCTTEYLKGYTVLDYEREQDPQAHKLQTAIRNHMSASPQTISFLEQLHVFSAQALEKGSLSKTLQQSISRKLNTIMGNLFSSRKFDIEVINEIAHERVREAQTGLRRLLTPISAPAYTLLPAPEVNPTLPILDAAGLLLLSTSRSSEKTLFNDLNPQGNPFALIFSNACFDQSDAPHKDNAYTKDKVRWEVLFSPDLYPALLRGDGSSCCCTISRMDGKLTAEVPIHHSAVPPEVCAEIDVDKATHDNSELMILLQLIQANMTSMAYKGKKGLAALHQDISLLPELYSRYLDAHSAQDKQLVMSTLQLQQAHFERAVTAELARLPNGNSSDAHEHIARITRRLYDDITSKKQ
jgi:hypothetical protein